MQSYSTFSLEYGKIKPRVLLRPYGIRIYLFFVLKVYISVNN